MVPGAPLDWWSDWLMDRWSRIWHHVGRRPGELGWLSVHVVFVLFCLRLFMCVVTSWWVNEFARNTQPSWHNALNNSIHKASIRHAHRLLFGEQMSVTCRCVWRWCYGWIQINKQQHIPCHLLWSWGLPETQYANNNTNIGRLRLCIESATCDIAFRLYVHSDSKQLIPQCLKTSLCVHIYIYVYRFALNWLYNVVGFVSSWVDTCTQWLYVGIIQTLRACRRTHQSHKAQTHIDKHMFSNFDYFLICSLF